MTPLESAPITGSTTLTYRDNLAILLSQFPRMLSRLAFFVVFVFVSLGIIATLFDSRLSLRDDPVTALSVMAGELWPFALASYLMVIAFVLIANTLKWSRYPDAIKILTYTVDDKGIATSDAAGASLVVPWSMVKRSRRMRGYVLMDMTLGGMRFAPLRAFENGEAVWDIVRSKTPAC